VGLLKSVDGVGEFLCDRRMSASTPRALKIEAVCSFETSVISNPDTQCNNPGDHNPQRHSCWNLKCSKAARKLELAICRHVRFLPSTCSSEISRRKGRGKKKHARNCLGFKIASSTRPPVWHCLETADHISIKFYIWDPLLKSAKDSELFHGRPALVFWTRFRLSSHVAGWLNNDAVRDVCGRSCRKKNCLL
jgi:hypothetical protein